MIPTVARLVHYRTINDGDDGPPLAAIVVACSASDDPHGHKHDCSESCFKVSLSVFLPYGLISMSIPDAPYSEKPKAGAWSWPPRV
jgi:hypothetical protein